MFSKRRTALTRVVIVGLVERMSHHVPNIPDVPRVGVSLGQQNDKRTG